MSFKISGIASGLDTESIISVLIKARSVPIDTLNNQIEEETYKVSAYDMMSDLATSLQEYAYQLSSWSTWQQRVGSSSDTDVATVTAQSSTTTGSYKLSVSQLAQAETVASSSFSGQVGASGSFTINGTSISVSSSNTLSDIATKINTAFAKVSDDKAVKAYLISDKLVIESGNTGADYAMTIANASGSAILESLGIIDEDSGDLNITQEAKDLSATLNGVDISGSSNVVSDALDGVSISVVGEGDSTIKIANDTDTIKSLISDFLDAYNNLYTYIEKATEVVLDSDTNEASSTGILQGDFLPTDIETKLFMMLTAAGDAAGSKSGIVSLYSIGIGSSDSSAGNFGILDEDQLDQALEDNFDDVVKLFRSSANTGIADKIDNYLNDQVLDVEDGSLATRIIGLDDGITQKENRVDKLQAQLSLYESALWTHYAQMEDYVGEIQSSLSYLLSNLGNS